MQHAQPRMAELIRLGFGDAQKPPLPASIAEFLTWPLTDWADVVTCLEAIGAHGAFDPRTVARELAPLFPELMDLRVGRQEYDVLIVADLPFWTNQQTRSPDPEGPGRRLRTREREALAEQLEAAFKRAGGGCGMLIDDDLEFSPGVIHVSGHWTCPMPVDPLLS